MILVAGAAGNVGGAVVASLVAKKVPLRALVRSAAKAGALASLPGVEVVEGDMTRPESLRGPLRGVTRAFLVSSVDPAMVEVQSSFIAAAAEAGVKHLIKLSGMAADADSPFRFARAHAQVERVLESSGMAFTHLRPAEFMSMYFRLVPPMLGKGVLPLPMADARIASIEMGDIGEVAAAVLTGPAHEGKTYLLTGPESLSMAEVAQHLSKVIGKAVRYVDQSPKEAEQAWLAAGIPAFRVEGLNELYAERRKGKEAEVTSVVRDVFGLKPTPFTEFAQRNAAIFRGEKPAPRV